MARNRQCENLKLGEYQGAAIWQSGSGIEERTRYAEGIGIKVEEKWVSLYLRDGEEIVRLSRKTNDSAQIYLEMSLRDAVKERIVNGVENSSSCCWGKIGWERDCGGRIASTASAHRARCTPLNGSKVKSKPSWIPSSRTRTGRPYWHNAKSTR